MIEFPHQVRRRAYVHRIASIKHGRTRELQRAYQAAEHAGERHVTRMRASLLFGVPLELVDAAFAHLYPESRRVRT